MSDEQTTGEPDDVPIAEEAAAEAVPQPPEEAADAPAAGQAPDPVTPSAEPAPEAAGAAGWAPPAAEPASGPAEPAPGWDAALAGSGNEAFAEKPEVLVGAAFAGGVVLALILKRLAR